MKVRQFTVFHGGYHMKKPFYSYYIHDMNTRDTEASGLLSPRLLVSPSGPYFDVFRCAQTCPHSRATGMLSTYFFLYCAATA